MSNFAADDTQAIAQRLKEIEAEKKVALTGTSAPVTGQEQKTEELPQGYGYAGVDYSAWLQNPPYQGYKGLLGHRPVS